MTTIGIIGSGNIGSNVAKAAVEHGFDVVISNSRGPETLQDLVAELEDRASAATVEDAIRKGDLILVAIPLAAVGKLPLEPFEDKIVMDANNYYPQRDGRIEALDSNESTTSELLQKHLPHSHVVKAFNHIYAKDIPQAGKPKGSANRRALAIAGNTDSAKDAVAHFLDALGYDVLDLGPLGESWKIERDTPGYGASATLEELSDLTTDVERVQQV